MNTWFLFIIGFLAFAAVIVATVFNGMASVAIKDMPEFDAPMNDKELGNAAANADWATVVCGVGGGLILVGAIIYAIYYVRSGGLGVGSRWIAGIISVICIIILVVATFLSVASFGALNRSRAFANVEARQQAYNALLIACILESVSVATFTIFLFYSLFPSTTGILQSQAAKFSEGAVTALRDAVAI